MKKLLVIMLALVMAVMMFGCTPKTDTPADTATKAPEATEAPEPEEEPTEEPAESKFTEEMTLTYSGLLNSGYDHNNPEDAIWQELHNRFNIQWETTAVTWTDWDERSRLWINAGDMPDFMMYNFNVTDYMSYVKQGLVAALPDGWETAYPNIQKDIEVGAIGYPLAELLGSHNVLPHAIYFNSPYKGRYITQWSMYIRKDWAQKLGYEVKEVYTVSELVTMWKDFIASFDELGLTKGTDYAFVNRTSDMYGFFVNWAGKRPGIYYDETVGQYVWGCDAQEAAVVESLNLWAQGFTEGWIHPGFYTFTQNQEDRDIFYNGHAFAIMMEGHAPSVRGQMQNFMTNTGLDWKDCVQQIVVLGDDNMHHDTEQLNYWASTLYNPDLTPEKFDRILSMTDWVLTDEGQRTVRLGIEGVDWKFVDGDKIEITREIDPETNAPIGLSKKYNLADVFVSFAVCSDNFQRFAPDIPQEFIDSAERMYANKDKYANETGSVWPYDIEYWFYSSPVKDKLNINYGTDFAELVTKGGDMAANLAEYKESKRALIDEVLADLNANVAPKKKK